MTLADVVRFCREDARPRWFDPTDRRGGGGHVADRRPNATCLDSDRRARAIPRSWLPAPIWGPQPYAHGALSCDARMRRSAGLSSRSRSESAGLAETVEGLRIFGGRDVPIIRLPRLAGDPGDRWRSGPPRHLLPQRVRACLRMTETIPIRPDSAIRLVRTGPGPRLATVLPDEGRPPPLPVVRTHGCRIVLADGRELIDGIASWWSVCHGYNHPYIREAVAAAARHDAARDVRRTGA